MRRHVSSELGQSNPDARGNAASMCTVPQPLVPEVSKIRLTGRCCHEQGREAMQKNRQNADH